ncbi:hypothetical protein [Kiritimatiella glycovorans]|uniref:nicotinate phosphoribosyltransferase n=1 Tax=Kiritimatiella glycovorans TaxID=1307763 RepID=A0A0G3EJY0_9BACT|nr:hypothetical protein [Kiritimatiella glycovorans]AKJ65100.1 Nicotinate phosphoribosyltransferase pncB2 [Kiritimatiella glycovorans]
MPPTGQNGKQRLPSHIFDLPVQEIRRGYRSDIYFWREKRALEEHGMHPEVTLQVFQKKDAILCGIDEAIAVLKLGSGTYRDFDQACKLFDRYLELKHEARKHFLTDREKYMATVREKTEISARLDDLWTPHYEDLVLEALHDGDRIAPWETVMHITGDASLFAHLETVYLGVLARRTRIATNVRRTVDAAGDKVVLFFPARFDHWAVQGGDGYAAHIGGAGGVSTDAQGEWWGESAKGTVPHALIAAVGGDTVQAVKLFDDSFPDVNLVALVDFDNDCVGTSLQCCEALGDRLWGVRLDTAGTMVDRSMIPRMGEEPPTGVTPQLVESTRRELDRHGYEHVRIIVSGGFHPDRIRMFEDMAVPVDAYGVGSSLMRGHWDFTADVVLREGEPCAKQGRTYHPNARMERVM